MIGQCIVTSLVLKPLNMSLPAAELFCPIFGYKISIYLYRAVQYIFLLYVLHVVDWSVGPCLNRPESSNLNNLTNSEAAVWIKITSSWMGLLVYIWTLIAPVLFPDRDFDWSDHTFLMEPIEQNNIPYQCLHVLVRIHKSYC